MDRIDLVHRTRLAAAGGKPIISTLNDEVCHNELRQWQGWPVMLRAWHSSHNFPPGPNFFQPPHLTEQHQSPSAQPYQHNPQPSDQAVLSTTTLLLSTPLSRRLSTAVFYVNYPKPQDFRYVGCPASAPPSPTSACSVAQHGGSFLPAMLSRRGEELKATLGSMLKFSADAFTCRPLRGGRRRHRRGQQAVSELHPHSHSTYVHHIPRCVLPSEHSGRLSWLDCYIAVPSSWGAVIADVVFNRAQW